MSDDCLMFNVIRLNYIEKKPQNVTAKFFQMQWHWTQLNETFQMSGRSTVNTVAQREVDFPNFWCSDLQYITGRS